MPAFVHKKLYLIGEKVMNENEKNPLNGVKNTLLDMNEKKSFRNFLVSPGGKICMIVVFYFVVFLVVGLLIGLDLGIIMFPLIIACGFFGWRALNRITPNIFLILPIGGWLLYYLIKALLSCFIGLFVFPFVVSKWIVAKLEEKMREN